MDSQIFDDLYRRGKVELELVPQGNLAARIQGRRRAGAVFTPTGYGTPLAEGKETREIDGRHYVLEYPIKADFALIKAHRATAGATRSIARRRATLARSWRQRRKPPS